MGKFFLWVVWPYIVVKLTKLVMKSVGKNMSNEDAQQLKNDFKKVTKAAVKAIPEVKVVEKADTRKVLIGAAVIVGVSVLSATVAVAATKKRLK